MIDIRNLVEDKVNELWKEFRSNKLSNEEYCQFSPHSIAEVPCDGLIFVGLNPSLTKKVREELEKENDINCEFHKLNYNVKNIKEEYHYFKKFFDVAEKTAMKWGHIDILYNRETNQKKVKNLLETERGKNFLRKQCLITKIVLDKLIDEKNPRIFVVTNSLARDLLREYQDKNGRDQNENKPKKTENWFGYDFVWNDEIGTYLYKNNPFFFSSMLTGQRALDTGSYERLIWQINFVKNKWLEKNITGNSVDNS